jgi:hypothetical protein
VLGLRADDGNWKFHLQENATVFFCTLKKSKGAVVKGTMRSMAMPMLLREFFPGGTPTVRLMPRMPKKV